MVGGLGGKSEVGITRKRVAHQGGIQHILDASRGDQHRLLVPVWLVLSGYKLAVEAGCQLPRVEPGSSAGEDLPLYLYTLGALVTWAEVPLTTCQPSQPKWPNPTCIPGAHHRVTASS